MAQITGGKVSFARTVQATQYEPKRAEVELTFAVAEGEDFGPVLDSVVSITQLKALEMVGLKKAPSENYGDGPAAIPAALAAVKEANEKLKENAKEAYAALKLSAEEKEAKKAAKTLAEKSNTAKPPADDLSISGFLDRTQQANGAADPDADLLADAAPKEITDQELVAAVTNTNAIVKDPKKIHELREKFVKLPKGLRDIPQADRPTFMEGLAKLKASVKG